MDSLPDWLHNKLSDLVKQHVASYFQSNPNPRNEFGFNQQAQKQQDQLTDYSQYAQKNPLGAIDPFNRSNPANQTIPISTNPNINFASNLASHFGGDMQAVNPGGFAGATSLGKPGPAYASSVDAMTSRPMGGPPLSPSRGFNGVQAFNPTAGGGTNEQMIEQAGGWSPGMRQQFDMALFTKDPAAVRHLLPFVPQDYLVKFSQEIGSILNRK